MTGLFDTIKHSIDILDVAARYGLHINRRGKALCPFHPDRNPSLSFKGQRFKCFACGSGGDVIELVQNLHNLPTPLDAARLLDSDYCLGLFDYTREGRKKVQNAAAKRARDKQLADSFEVWCCEAFFTVRWYMWHLRDVQKVGAPKGMDDELSEGFIRALRELSDIEYMYDVLAFGDFVMKVKFYQHWRKRVRDIEYYRKSCDIAKSA